MAVSHRNYYLAITNGSIVPVKTIDEAKLLAHGKPGGLTKGFDSYDDAVAAIPAIRAEIKRRLSKKKVKRNRRDKYQQKENFSHLKSFLPEYQTAKNKLVLTCYFGGKNADSTITGSDGKSEIVALSSGATAKLKYLELAQAAIQYAENAINDGVNSVEVWGIDGSVLVTLNEWAPRYRERGWVNSYHKPIAHREVIEPMLALYEKLGDKVKLNTGEQPIDNDAPF
ncbi:hypothetical protein [Vibrio splendidus]|uniref:hypothetical protein n=1 Tax=Vibrio splendidus TaxID=29497 RepID=UPI000C84226F|nr:hypothetical protein [Vibrio splendidus]PMH09503.1 hypothetical protein BCU75_14345 [Vibrio splendidus]